MRAVLLASALGLCACDRGTDPQPSPASPTPPPAATEAAPPQRSQAAQPVPVRAVLTPDGYGRLRIGMTVQEAERALGGPLQSDDGYAGEPGQCRYVRSDLLPGVLLMFEQERLARIDTAKGSPVKTDKGLGLGATRKQVRAAYGAALHEDGHKYLPAPAAYLESWNSDRTRGVRYELDEQGRVADIYAGGAAVNYVEGCS